MTEKLLNVQPGAAAAFTVTCQNNGNQPYTEPFTISLTGSAKFIEKATVHQGAGSLEQTETLITWTGSLDAGSSVAVKGSATANADAAAGSEVKIAFEANAEWTASGKTSDTTTVEESRLLQVDVSFDGAAL